MKKFLSIITAVAIVTSSVFSAGIISFAEGRNNSNTVVIDNSSDEQEETVLVSGSAVGISKMEYKLNSSDVFVSEAAITTGDNGSKYWSINENQLEKGQKYNLKITLTEALTDNKKLQVPTDFDQATVFENDTTNKIWASGFTAPQSITKNLNFSISDNGSSKEDYILISGSVPSEISDINFVKDGTTVTSPAAIDASTNAYKAWLEKKTKYTINVTVTVPAGKELKASNNVTLTKGTGNIYTGTFTTGDAETTLSFTVEDSQSTNYILVSGSAPSEISNIDFVKDGTTATSPAAIDASTNAYKAWLEKKTKYTINVIATVPTGKELKASNNVTLTKGTGNTYTGTFTTGDAETTLNFTVEEIATPPTGTNFFNDGKNPTANDAAIVLNYILKKVVPKGLTVAQIEKWGDQDENDKLTSNDVAIILLKTLGSEIQE